MGNIFLSMMLISLAILVVSMMWDRRRFSNGIFLLIFILCTFMYFMDVLGSTYSGDLTVYLFLVLVLAITFVVPFVLVLNGIVMIKREGKNLQNLLSLLFGLFIMGGAVILMRSLYHSSDEPVTAWRILFFIIGFGVFYVSLIFLAFMFYTWLIKIIPGRKHYDYVIVLGAGLLDGNRISKLLADRLDKAAKVFQLNAQGGKIICSGGQGQDETISEAEAMKDYLISKGIDENDILMEDRSTDTMENLAFSKKIIDSKDPEADVVVVTSGYHVLRALIYSRKVGLKTDGIGGHTALYYWPSAMIREYCAIVKYNLISYVLIYLVFTGWLLNALHIIHR